MKISLVFLFLTASQQVSPWECHIIQWLELADSRLSRVGGRFGIISLLCLQLVECDYELRIAVHSYRNNKHLNARGWCCDIRYYLLPFLCDPCDNYFVFCLSEPEGNRCEVGEAHTGEVGGDELTFSPGENGSIIGHQPNPLTFINAGPWPVSDWFLSTHLSVLKLIKQNILLRVWFIS